MTVEQGIRGQIAADLARAEATADPNLVSATMTVAPGADPDRVLRRLWDAGFKDAFAERY